MPGKHITDQQMRLYMSERKLGQTQKVSAAKSGISERSARRVDVGEHQGGLTQKTLANAPGSFGTGMAPSGAATIGNARVIAGDDL